MYVHIHTYIRTHLHMCVFTLMPRYTITQLLSHTSLYVHVYICIHTSICANIRYASVPRVLLTLASSFCLSLRQCCAGQHRKVRHDGTTVFKPQCVPATSIAAVAVEFASSAAASATFRATTSAAAAAAASFAAVVFAAASLGCCRCENVVDPPLPGS